MTESLKLEDYKTGVRFDPRRDTPPPLPFLLVIVEIIFGSRTLFFSFTDNP